MIIHGLVEETKFIVPRYFGPKLHNRLTDEGRVDWGDLMLSISVNDKDLIQVPVTNVNESTLARDPITKLTVIRTTSIWVSRYRECIRGTLTLETNFPPSPGATDLFLSVPLSVV